MTMDKNADMNAKLKLPLTLPCGATLPNRLCKAAMTESLSQAGQPGEDLVRLYRTWGAGGTGLIITGNVQIDGDHLENAGNVVLDRPLDAAEQVWFRSWAQAAQSGGAKIWMQLNHAGRQTPININPHPAAPSAVPLGIPGRFGMPVELDHAGIERLIGQFAGAAATARTCGFDGVQIHAAHGYLLSSFLSPLANQRTDDWGGSLENRARLLRRIVAAVRSEVGGGFPISVKMNSADFQHGGFMFEDAITLAGWLAEDGVDLLEISGGSYEQVSFMGQPGGAPQQKASTRQREAYFLDFARALLDGTTPPLMVTGGFRSAETMNEAIESGIGMIGIGRPLCAEPDGPSRLIAGKIDALARFEAQLMPPEPGAVPAAAPDALPDGFAIISWFYQQIRRLGRGLPPDRTLPVLEALLAEREEDGARAAARSAARVRA